MVKWRLLDLAVPSYADMSISIRPAFTRAKNEKLIPDTVVLASFTEKCLQIQYYNDPYKDIDLEAARRLGIKVKRGGLSGGGPIYGDDGIIVLNLFLDRASPVIPRSDEVALAKLIHAVADQVGTYYDIPMRYRPLNDGEYWDPSTHIWKKVLACSVTGLENAIQLILGVQAGRADAAAIRQVITPPKEKFTDKAAKDVGQRVGYLEDVLGAKPDWAELKRLLAAAVAHAYGVELEGGELTEKEKDYVKAEAERFDNEEWLMARSEAKFGDIPPGAKKGEAIAKPANGPLLRVTVLRENDMLRDVLITGSLHVSPIDAMARLEGELKGLPVQREIIARAVSNFYATHRVRTPMLNQEMIVDTLLAAAESAEREPLGNPIS